MKLPSLFPGTLFSLCRRRKRIARPDQSAHKGQAVHVVAVALSVLLLCVQIPAPVQAIGPAACPWVVADNAFSGGALEQALCLLATPAKGGRIVPLTSLPATFDALVGSALYVTPEVVEQFMRVRKVKEGDVGGAAGLRVSLSEGVPAQYFVLHGLSGHRDARGAMPSLNALRTGWHVAVAPDGNSRTIEDFFSPLCATRFEKELAGLHARGRFLHVILLPYKRGAAASVSGDQYRRLADIYIVASARAEKWLVPVLAGTLDKGQSDGAVSPAGFDLEKWADAVRDAYRTLTAGR